MCTPICRNITDAHDMCGRIRVAQHVRPGQAGRNRGHPRVARHVQYTGQQQDASCILQARFIDRTTTEHGTERPPSTLDTTNQKPSRQGSPRGTLVKEARAEEGLQSEREIVEIIAAKTT